MLRTEGADTNVKQKSELVQTTLGEGKARTEDEASLLLGRLIPMHSLDGIDSIVEDLGPARVFMRDIEREVKGVPSLAEVAEPLDEAIGPEEPGWRILQEVPERLDRRIAQLVGEGDERGALEQSRDVPLERCRAMQHRSLFRTCWPT